MQCVGILLHIQGIGEKAVGCPDTSYLLYVYDIIYKFNEKGDQENL